jgi:hypothetical protein
MITLSPSFLHLNHHLEGATKVLLVKKVPKHRRLPIALERVSGAS